MTNALKTHSSCTGEAQKGWGWSSRIRLSKVVVTEEVALEMTLERWVTV